MSSFCFETWIVLEHEKQGQKQDLLFDTFWLMTFFESISLVGSQGITNLLLDDDNKGILLPYRFAALVSVIGILYIRKAPSISTAHHASVIASHHNYFLLMSSELICTIEYRVVEVNADDAFYELENSPTENSVLGF